MTALGLAHFGVRVADLAISREWYRQLTGGEIVHDNGVAVFFALDEDHHRFVLWSDSGAEPRAKASLGVDHIAFRCADLAALAERCAGLDRSGIRPETAINQGFCCSLFYRDPDGNEVELTADNFEDAADCRTALSAALADGALASSCSGMPFDPLEFIELWQTGAPNAQLAQIGA
ncbi:VOC family protein [Sphingopyxis granuli]|uniref:VOC family protein n=1 Tax=Sphingopyxis granuli TaxID=267128 RepID=UPI00301E603F